MLDSLLKCPKKARFWIELDTIIRAITICKLRMTNRVDPYRQASAVVGSGLHERGHLQADSHPRPLSSKAESTHKTEILILVETSVKLVDVHITVVIVYCRRSGCVPTWGCY